MIPQKRSGKNFFPNSGAKLSFIMLIALQKFGFSNFGIFQNHLFGQKNLAFLPKKQLNMTAYIHERFCFSK
jgi:hypothetical protein